MTSVASQKALLRATVSSWSRRLGAKPKGVYIQKRNSKWASCSHGGRTYLSRDLLRQAPAFQGVVVVHELLHLRVPNHGRLFQALLSAHLPPWRRSIRNTHPANRTRTHDADLPGPKRAHKSV